SATSSTPSRSRRCARWCRRATRTTPAPSPPLAGESWRGGAACPVLVASPSPQAHGSERRRPSLLTNPYRASPIIGRTTRNSARRMVEMILDASDGTRDHSATFGRVRPLIADARGETLIDFVKTLTPDYAVVYRDIALGYVLLTGTLVAAIAAEHLGAPRLLVV